MTSFTLTGSGTVSVVTAPIYLPGRSYLATQSGHRPVVIKATRDGRLHITIQLGNDTATASIRTKAAA